MRCQCYQSIELSSQKESNEKQDIVCSDAIVHPSTVVVEYSNAFTTLETMF